MQASKPSGPSSEPCPESFTPPNGESAPATMVVLMPIMPDDPVHRAPGDAQPLAVDVEIQISEVVVGQLRDAGLFAPIFARRYIVLRPEHAPEVGGTIESIIEGNRRHAAAALRAGLQCP